MAFTPADTVIVVNLVQKHPVKIVTKYFGKSFFLYDTKLALFKIKAGKGK